MQGTAEIHDHLLRIFPAADSELLDLFASAWENANLTYTDFCTINDLLDGAGYKQSQSLHVLLLNLFLALEEGSLCIAATEDGLARRLRDLVDEDASRNLARQILDECQPEQFPELIGTTADDNRPVVLVHVGPERFYYFQRYLHHELVFQAALLRRTGLQARPVWTGLETRPTANADLDLDKIREALAEVLFIQPRLGERQCLAVALSLLRNFLIISGGPGTGKTSIVVTLLRALVRCGFAPERIALAAPTGRAAQRLTDAIRAGLNDLPANCSLAERQLAEVEAHTLHHLLRYNPSRGTFACHAENPVPADVIIVDEVSMVGLALMAQLLQAARADAKLILLGDKDQLPSVEAGAVLAHLLPNEAAPAYSPELCAQLERVHSPLSRYSGRGVGGEGSGPAMLRDAVVLLDENYRSQPHIREVAQAINEQRISIIDTLPTLTADVAATEAQGGCWWLPQAENSVRPFHAVLHSWAERHYLHAGGDGASYRDLIEQAAQAFPFDVACLHQLFRILGHGRLLTVVREGPYGCVDINRFLDEALRPHLDRGSRIPFFAGAPILITRNDHARRLYNGDIGVTLKHPQGGYHVAFARQDGYLSFPAESLPNHELGFALTVHKSQGTEYDQVLLVLPPVGGRRLLTKEIVYTGITRAKHLAIICGTKEVLSAALARRITRDSGILRRTPH